MFLLATCITQTEAVTGHGYQKAVVMTFLRRSLRIWMFGGNTRNWLVPRRTPSRIGYDVSSSLCPFCVYLGQVGASEKMPSRFPLCGKDVWQPREARWGQEATHGAPCPGLLRPGVPAPASTPPSGAACPQADPISSAIPSISLCKPRGLDHGSQQLFPCLAFCN